jgi:60 kDa SS-A/Ro ribonucleoprotein
MMVGTYVNAVTRTRDVANGLSTTHQGGEAYTIDELRQLRRFLILGSEGGTYYVNEKELTAKNIEAVQKALKTHGTKAIDEIVAVSHSGRAPKNDPALLALALAAAYTDDNAATQNTIRSYALDNLPKVARTGTHLFHFAAYVDGLRGWGPALRRGFANWYLNRNEQSLAEQITKYQSRDGWSHRDILRLAHPQPKNEAQNAIFKYVTKGELSSDIDSKALEYLGAVEQVKRATDSKEIIDLITRYKLPREVLPTQALNDNNVWEALLYAGDGMPIMAMTRNLGTMSKNGFLTQGSDAARFIVNRLNDQEAILKSRSHPIDFLKAKLVYQSGQGFRGSSTWTPVTSVINSLETAFYSAFGNVEPSGKRVMLALDVSASMSGGTLCNVPGLSPRVASAAVALITARTERDYEILGFSHQLVDLGISGHDSLDAVITKISRLPFGGTDCNLPIRFASSRNQKYDAFVVYTDSENGGSNVAQTLREYRRTSGVGDAKLIVNAMVASYHSLADPSDPNMLDVQGFDSAAPQIISQFIAGRV